MNHLPIVLSPVDANQENVATSTNPLANTRSTTQETRSDHIDSTARAVHIDRLEKESGKHSCGLRSSNAEKVDSMLCVVDSTETVFALVNNTRWYLSSIGNVGNSNGPSTSIGIAIKALHLAIAAGRRQLIRQVAFW